jgi:hypothetical protein
MSDRVCGATCRLKPFAFYRQQDLIRTRQEVYQNRLIKGKLIGNHFGLSVGDITFNPRRYLATETTSGAVGSN